MNTISRKAYLDSGGCSCPRCGSKELSGDSIQVDAMIAWCNAWCDKCGLSWTDEYDLVGIRSVYCDDSGDFVVTP